MNSYLGGFQFLPGFMQMLIPSRRRVAKIAHSMRKGDIKREKLPHEFAQTITDIFKEGLFS